MALLEVDNLRRSFGGLTAVNGVSFKVARGHIKAIIGPNGAGKTTVFNLVSGLLPPDAGSLRYDGRTITGLKPYRIARLGISRTFQTPSLFMQMTVLENVMVGRHARTRRGIWASALRLPGQPREERAIRAAALERLQYVGLADVADWPVSALSFGRRRMTELARALATDPQLLMLDEPASGLNTKETEDLAALICRIRDGGVTLLLVEHDMSLVMDISDDILVLNYGTTLAEGPPSIVRNDPRVVEVYLGGQIDRAAR